VESTFPDVIYVNNTEDWTLRPSVRMTLSRPVNILGFEIEPNWGYPTSSTITFYSAGVAVGSVTIAFPWQDTFTDGTGSAQLVAINSPDPIDYVDITNPDELAFAIANLRYGPVQGLKIDCAPNPATRGTPVTCTAKDANDQPVQANNWKFTSTDPQLEWTYDRAGIVSSTWSGPVALSGEVTAKASGARSGSTQLNVLNRAWDASKLAFPTVVSKGQGPAGIALNARVLYDPPGTFGDLGYGIHWIVPSPTYSSKFQPIETGPNMELTYALGIPFDMRSEVAVNAAAMSSTSKWSSYHGVTRTTTTTNGVTTTWCSKADVTNLLVPVEQHEGMRVHPTSHVQTSYDGYVAWLNFLVEPWVGTDIPTEDDLELIKELADAFAYDWSNGITHSLTGNPIPASSCIFRYIP
jgi:hypothetical protein